MLLFITIKSSLLCFNDFHIRCVIFDFQNFPSSMALVAMTAPSRNENIHDRQLNSYLWYLWTTFLTFLRWCYHNNVDSFNELPMLFFPSNTGSPLKYYDQQHWIKTYKKSTFNRLYIQVKWTPPLVSAFENKFYESIFVKKFW